jgi:hypothetical protein
MSEAMQAEFGLKHNVHLILRAGNSSLLRAFGCRLRPTARNSSIHLNTPSKSGAAQFQATGGTFWDRTAFPQLLFFLRFSNAEEPGAADPVTRIELAWNA